MLRNSRLQRRTERYPAALTHLIPERLNNVTKDQTTAHKNKKHMLKFGIGLKQLEVVQLVYYKEEAAVSKKKISSNDISGEGECAAKCFVVQNRKRLKTIKQNKTYKQHFLLLRTHISFLSLPQGYIHVTMMASVQHIHWEKILTYKFEWRPCPMPFSGIAHLQSPIAKGTHIHYFLQQYISLRADNGAPWIH